MRRFAAGAAGLALSAGTAWADMEGCVWMYPNNSRGESGFETLVLASGYARARMYDESFEVLAKLEEDPPTPVALASIHLRRGHNYYQLGELDKARRHFLLAIESGRLPISVRSQVWHMLMLVAFERGDYSEAAVHAERSREDHFAADCTRKDQQWIAKEDLWHAMYLSHADRDKALHYARRAVAAAAEGTLDAADLAWVAQLEAGPAPAPIRTMDRPWLREPPAPISKAEVLRRNPLTTTIRRLVRQQPPPPTRSDTNPPGEPAYRWETQVVVGPPPSVDVPGIHVLRPVLPPLPPQSDTAAIDSAAPG